MGAAVSSVSSTMTVNQSIVNNDDLQDIKRTTNDNITNIISKAALSCAATTSQVQKAGGSFGNVKGNFDFGNVNQEQTSTVDFSCVNINDQSNDIANTIANTVATHISTNISTATQTKLAQAATAQAKVGELPIGTISASEAKTNTKYNIHYKTNINETLKDIINNVIEKNVTTNTAQSCLASANQIQSNFFKAGNIAGSVDIGDTSQKQTLKVVTQCLNKNMNVNTAIDKIANTLNTIVSNTIKNKAKLAAKTTTGAIARTKGISSVLPDVSKDLGALYPIVIAIVVCSIIVAIIYMYIKYSGSSNDSY